MNITDYATIVFEHAETGYRGQLKIDSMKCNYFYHDAVPLSFLLIVLL